MILSEVDTVLVGVIEVVDHAVHHICQQQVVVVVEHTDVVDDCPCTADLLLLNLKGDQEVLYCHIEYDLKGHLEFKS
jgi:hypothetical protein